MIDAPADDLVARWRQGDEQAAAELFRRYAGRLIALARSQMSRQVARRVDPEDIVQSVYRSFFAETREGRYELSRGGGLWRLLVTMTLHKLQNQAKHNLRAKRAVGREQSFGGESSLRGLHGRALAQGPSPVEAVALAELLEQVMHQLAPLYRRILELRLNGYKLEEIAAAVCRSERTVCRVLDEIKEHLEDRQALTANA